MDYFSEILSVLSAEDPVSQRYTSKLEFLSDRGLGTAVGARFVGYSHALQKRVGELTHLKNNLRGGRMYDRACRKTLAAYWDVVAKLEHEFDQVLAANGLNEEWAQFDAKRQTEREADEIWGYAELWADDPEEGDEVARNWLPDKLPQIEALRNRILDVGKETARSEHFGSSSTEQAVEPENVTESDDVESPSSENTATKTCPDCAETIKGAARVCRFCGYRFQTA